MAHPSTHLGNNGKRGFYTALGVSLFIHAAVALTVGQIKTGGSREQVSYFPVQTIELGGSAFKGGGSGGSRGSSPKPSPPSPPPPSTPSTPAKAAAGAQKLAETAPVFAPSKQPMQAGAPQKTPVNAPSVQAGAPAKTPANTSIPQGVIQPPPGTRIASTEPVRTEKDVMEKIAGFRQKMGGAEGAGVSASSAPQGRTAGDVDSAIAAMRQRMGTPGTAPGNGGQGSAQASPSQPVTRFGEGGIEGSPGGGNGGGGPGRNVMLQMRATSYYNQLWDHVRQFWQLPPSMSAEGLSTTISVTLARDGTVLSNRVEESSGNPVFDQSALKAFVRAGKMPPIPAEFPDDVVEVGFRFRE